MVRKMPGNGPQPAGLNSNRAKICFSIVPVRRNKPPPGEFPSAGDRIYGLKKPQAAMTGFGIHIIAACVRFQPFAAD